MFRKARLRDIFLSFQDISGESNEERAKFYLESSGWKLDLALSAFYENGQEEGHEGEKVKSVSQKGHKKLDKKRKASGTI